MGLRTILEESLLLWETTSLLGLLPWKLIQLLFSHNGTLIQVCCNQIRFVSTLITLILKGLYIYVYIYIILFGSK